MAYGNFKDLPRKTTFDKILLDKAFNIAKNWRDNGYQRGLASMFTTFSSTNFPMYTKEEE